MLALEMMGLAPRQERSRRMTRAALVMLLAWLWSARGMGQPADVDAGVEDDAGVTARAPDDRAPMLALEPVLTLPPAKPPPQLAPVVEEPLSQHPPERPVASADRPAFLIKTVLGLLALITLAYLGGHPRVLALERRLGISQVITSGFPFVLLGWVARVPSVGILSDDLLAELSPLLRIGLGCIGIVCGFRFGNQLRARFVAAQLRAAAAVSALPFALVALLCGCLLLWMSGELVGVALRDPVFVRDAFILGTAGAMTAHSSTRIFRAEDPEGVLGRVLRLEELTGILGLAITAAYFRPSAAETWQLPGTAWMLLTIGLGAMLGLIAYLILKRPEEDPEFVLLVLGVIGFSAGTAGYLRLSPLVIAFVCGAFLALLSSALRQRLGEALRRLERPIYLLSLIVIGALWQLDDWRGWLLALVFAGARLLGKRLGVEWSDRLSGLSLTTEQKQALATSPIGPLAIAIVVNAQLLYPGGSISLIVAAVIVGGMVTEIVVQLASRRTPPPSAAAEARGAP